VEPGDAEQFAELGLRHAWVMLLAQSDELVQWRLLWGAGMRSRHSSKMG
jgi:hypothetical protein